MKTLQFAIALVFAIGIKANAREEPLPYVTLVSGYNAGFQNDSYQIPEGYVAEVLAMKIITGTEYASDPAELNTQSRIVVQRRNIGENGFQIEFTAETTPSTLPIFLGPINFQVLPEGGQGEFAFISLKISPLPTETVTPSNTVVIPEEPEGEFQVILESSTDLVNWNAALPGSYSSTNHGRFFRLRIIRN